MNSKIKAFVVTLLLLLLSAGLIIYPYYKSELKKKEAIELAKNSKFLGGNTYKEWIDGLITLSPSKNVNFKWEAKATSNKEIWLVTLVDESSMKVSWKWEVNTEQETVRLLVR